ncbi:hypothetical protein [Zavarzinia sp. CC-PAN008]|uniref:hypothetical protein n=1 Tax=Zavarzinia sp. CC-PAN008 TaxID=3243332 RepID=UPI003F7468BB
MPGAAVPGLAVLIGLALAGCAATGPTDDPLSRSASWFSYIGGEDIRAACQAGSPDHRRFVYNALYNEQVRGYEVTGGSAGASVEVRVWGPPALLSVSFSSGLGVATPERASASLSADEVAALDAALDASGFDRPAPAGLFLRSDRFFWTVAACRQGRFHFQAWQSPGTGFEAIRFDGPLFARDTTGIPVNPVRPTGLGPLVDRFPDRYSGPRTDGIAFQVQVVDNGLQAGPELAF